MEVSDANLQALAGYLQQTLSPDISVRKQGTLIMIVIECIVMAITAHYLICSNQTFLKSRYDIELVVFLWQLSSFWSQ